MTSDQVAPTTAAAGRENAWPRAVQAVLLAGSLAALAYFYKFFAQNLFQPTVDAAWLVAVVLWLAAFWTRERASLPLVKQPYWFYALYGVALLPHATNWRWAMTGDTLNWVFMGVEAAEHGLRKSALSAYGPDQFGNLQMLIHNGFMLLVSPTLFWHRVGKTLVAVAAAAGIYTAFARLVNEKFALLVTACSLSCSVCIVYVHSAFPYFDGIASAFALLALALWVRRDPQSQRAWLTLGALSGFMLFLTMNGWFMAMVVWLWLAVVVILRRAPLRLFVLAALTGLVVGGPMLYQWLGGSGGNQFDLVHSPNWTMQKVTRFFYEAAYMPFQSDQYTNGAFGPQLPWGFRWLFPPGIVLAVILFRRLPGAALMLPIYAVHVVGLVFSQGPYELVSPKRALFLIPMATYFVFLPFHRWLRSYLVILPIIAVWASFGIYDVVARVSPGILGYTLFDGVVEADQRFADAEHVCVYLPDDPRAAALKPGSQIERLYQLSPHTVLVSDADVPECRELLCYCSQEQCRHVDFAAKGYQPLIMLNTNELTCGRRTTPPNTPG